jgi:hypothetical protein
MPDGVKLARKQRQYRRLVWSAIVLAPVALFSVVIAAGAKNTPAASQSSSSSPFVSSPGRTAATLELQTWLAETPSPLPNGTLLSWNGATTIPNVTPPTTPGSAGPAVTWEAEVDHFTVVAGSTPYSVAVEVAIGPKGEAMALSGPSIAAQPPVPNNWAVGAPWPGLSATNQVSSSVVGAINGWVQAYTSGNPSTLALAVGDPNQNHNYVPLSGVSSAAATVDESAVLGPASAGQIIVEISLNIVWAGETTATTQPDSSGVSPPQTTMDLLVERASSAAPVVVAWGPPGTGPTLKPYGNASNPRTGL